MKLRLEMGRKLERSEVERLCFFNKGKTKACLKEDGKTPSARERLMIFVIG
jgi:hypothetical protein